MKIQIYHNKKYLPFNLYIGSLYNILTTNNFFVSNNYEVSIIDNMSYYSQETDYLILFLNYISDVYNVDTKNTKIIFIHADYIICHSENDRYLMCSYINEKNVNNTYVWEYNYLNIDIYEKNFINKKIHFIPLQYNSYLETIYNKYRLNIPHNEKPIDVLFMGAVNAGNRRDIILNEISKKYKLFIMNHVNDIDKYIHMIEQSKMVLHIYAREDNKSFDYYRLSLLYANKVLTISEKVENKHNLQELSGVMVETDYDNLVNTITDYLNKSDDEIANITNATYEIFKKNDMDNHICDFFNNN